MFYLLYIGCGPRSGLVIFGIGSMGSCQSLPLVWVMVSLLWKPGSLLLWKLKRFFPGRMGISCMSWLRMSFKSFDTVDRSILDCTLGRLGLPDWFRKACFAYHSQVRLRFKLAAGLGERWCSTLYGFHCGPVCPLVVVILSLCLMSFTLIILSVVRSVLPFCFC